MAWWLAPTSRWRTAMLERMARPDPLSAVASESKDKPPKRLGFVLLLDLYFGAGLFELLLDSLGVGLAHAFLHGLRRAVDQVLGLLQAQARDFAHRLDGVHLVLARLGEHHGELGLLLDSGRASARAGRGCGNGDGSGGGDAELVFHVLDELRELEDG